MIPSRNLLTYFLTVITGMQSCGRDPNLWLNCQTLKKKVLTINLKKLIG